MIRLFVALDLPPPLTRRLAAMEQAMPRSRWVVPENMHVTLRFIGEVSHGVAGDIDEVLARVSVPPFDMDIGGVGRFSTKGRVRTLWAGVERSDALVRLQAKIEQACQRAGLPPESRKFHPHITLARCRDVREALTQPFFAAFDGFSGGAIRVDAFTLYSSRLGRTGPVYSAEAHYPLAAGAAALLDDDRFADIAREWTDD